MQKFDQSWRKIFDHLQIKTINFLDHVVVRTVFYANFETEIINNKFQLPILFIRETFVNKHVIVIICFVNEHIVLSRINMFPSVHVTRNWLSQYCLHVLLHTRRVTTNLECMGSMFYFWPSLTR